MLTYVHASLFRSPARVLVNTVNVVGVMGKGIAKEFKLIFPEMFREYQLRCENKTIDIGKLYLFRGLHKWVLNFPTKKHWRQPSRPEYLEAGLRAFVAGYARQGITSIAFPRLGCGNGELSWEHQVRPLMEKYLDRLPIDIFVHHVNPASTPLEHHDVKATKAWLRSEPESLSFTEVWDDLLTSMSAHPQFSSFQGGKPFTARVVDHPEVGIRIDDGETLFVPQESLLEVWQNLRSAGFVTANSLVDGLDVHAGRIMALFASLPYVQRTEISQYKLGDQGEYRDALQFVPRVAADQGEKVDLPQTKPV